MTIKNMILMANRNDNIEDLLEGFTDEEIEKIMKETRIDPRGTRADIWWDRFKENLKNARAKKNRK